MLLFIINIINIHGQQSPQNFRIHQADFQNVYLAQVPLLSLIYSCSLTIRIRNCCLESVAKDQLRIERFQNKFLFYAAYLLIIKHPRHDYSLVFQTLNIPTFLALLAMNINFVYFLFNSTINVPVLISSIQLRVLSHFSRNQAPFYVLLHSTLYRSNNSLH